MSVFKNLIGERINGIFLREDRERVIFRTVNGKEFRYHTSGDCCNSVWINHMTGVGALGEGNTFDILRGALVTGAEDRGWTDNREGEHGFDVIQDGFFTLITDRGYIDFEVRNSHNGYYGGSVRYNKEDSGRLTDLEFITEDF